MENIAGSSSNNAAYIIHAFKSLSDEDKKKVVNAINEDFKDKVLATLLSKIGKDLDDEVLSEDEIHNEVMVNRYT